MKLQGIPVKNILDYDRIVNYFGLICLILSSFPYDG